MHSHSAVPYIIAAAAALLFAAPAAAQQDEQNWLRGCERQAERSDRAVACELRLATTTLDGGGLVVDAGPNGGIVVRSGSVSGVEISAGVQVQAGSDADARALAREIRLVTGTGSVSAEGPRTSGQRNWSVTYFITVPERVDLELSTVNGPITVRDVTGRIRAETTNGPLALVRLAGDVQARTSNGPLTVELSGGRWAGAGVDAETRNGPARLLVPDGYSAELEFGTINGPMNVETPITVTLQGRATSRIRTTLGSGGAPVRVVTSNGPFVLQRR